MNNMLEMDPMTGCVTIRTILRDEGLGSVGTSAYYVTWMGQYIVKPSMRLGAQTYARCGKDSKRSSAQSASEQISAPFTAD